MQPRVHPAGHVDDVIIVRAGQSGLGAAFALQRERVHNVLVIDENPAGQEGPWVTYARMQTLRTPKHITSIDLGVPSLTFRAWWQAQHGSAACNALDKIPRAPWMDYLRWYRTTLRLPARIRRPMAATDPGGGMSLLCTHVLDTANGRPAAGVPLRLFVGDTLHFEGVTHPDGRCPDLAALTLQPGRYRLEFEVAGHWQAAGMALSDPPFLQQVPIAFGIADDGHYHVPLLLSPYGYST